MMRYTEEQLQAIELRGTNVLLSAAAGSGKTTVLVERVLRLIVEDGADVDRMLIVTFTRAAAADMRAKLIRSLSQGAAQGDKRLNAQLRALERASITTLHAFCSDFLRSNFEAAGVDPAFRVLDEAESRRLFADAMDDAMEEAYQAGGEALQALDYGRGPEGVRKAAEALCAFLRERPDPFPWLEHACTGDQALTSAWTQEMVLSARRGILRAKMYVEMALRMPGCPGKYAQALTKDLSALNAMMEMDSYDALYRAVEEYAPARASARKDEADEETLNEVKRLRDAAKGEMKKIALLDFPLDQSLRDAKAMCENLNTLGKICRRAEELFDARKAERAGMTYSDLEQRTLFALRNEETARAVREKYDYVFVDEYQDTSDVQEALVSKIAQNGNLFMVGDVKQSIYRFRQAEPRLFLEKYYAYGRGEGGKRLALTQNFRSKDTVIDFVNLIFERLMTGGDAEIEYDALARLNAGSADAAGGEPVEIHLVDSVQKAQPQENAEEEEQREMETAEREGVLVAQRIREMMAEDPTLRYRDFVILTRNGRAAFTPMLPVLLAAGIPAYADGSAGYYDTLEVMLALEILRLVVNERSDRELIGVLRSGICGLSAQELAEIRVRSPRTAYVDAARLVALGDDALGRKVRTLFDRLASLRLRMGSMGLGDLVRAAVSESGLYMYVGALPGGKQRQANLDLLVDSAANYDRDISGSLARFLRYTEMLRDRGDGDAAHLLGENDDVVRLMTVHKSKGLEFRVVFGALTNRKFRAPDASRPLLAHGALGVGMSLYDAKLRTKRRTLPWAAIAQREIREGFAEEMRVLYVLLTRAKDRLVLTGTVRGMDSAMRRWSALGQAFTAAGSHLDMVMGALLDAEAQGVQPCVRRVAHAAEEFALPKMDRGNESVLQAFDEALANPQRFADDQLLRQMAWKYPDENAARRPMKLTVSGLLRELEGPETIAPMAERPRFLAETQGMTGAERGSAYHRAMQLLDLKALCGLSGAALTEAVRAQLNAMEAAGLMDAGQRDAVRPWNLARFLESALGQRLLHGANVRREWPFNVLMRAEDVLDLQETPVLDGTLIVQGVLDCCFVENGEWILLDYKTDRADDRQRLIEQYRRQLDTYALALERITGMRVREKWMCLLGVADAVRMDEHPPAL